MIHPILNLAAYCFSPISEPQGLRDAWFEAGQALGIKGTILIAPEGINLYFAAPEVPCGHMLSKIKAYPGLEQLTVKSSWSDRLPFKRFKVRVKKEIIRMDHPTIAPVQGRAPVVEADTLARWLDQGHDDQGRSVVLLDTRNDFEVDVGKFDQAVDWRIKKFTDFPLAAMKNREQFKDKTIVSYCTGGIRCEKAALYMQEIGFSHVRQLEGGILNYFDKTDGRHWQGRCFVFDERQSLDPNLKSV